MDRWGGVQRCSHTTHTQRNQEKSLVLKVPPKVMVHNRERRRMKRMTGVADQRLQWLYHRIWTRPLYQPTASTKCNKARSLPVKMKTCGPLEPEQ
ncbi:trans-sialidase, putative, partial [Trypanosoma cruzi marinkellei]